MLGALAILTGLAATAWGLRTITTRPRPTSLAGSLIAATGLALAFIGLFKLLVPTL
jgi:hypothetical protein